MMAGGEQLALPSLLSRVLNSRSHAAIGLVKPRLDHDHLFASPALAGLEILNGVGPRTGGSRLVNAPTQQLPDTN